MLPHVKIVDSAPADPRYEMNKKIKIVDSAPADSGLETYVPVDDYVKIDVVWNIDGVDSVKFFVMGEYLYMDDKIVNSFVMRESTRYHCQRFQVKFEKGGVFTADIENYVFVKLVGLDHPLTRQLVIDVG